MRLDADKAARHEACAPARGRPTHTRTLALLVRGKNINQETLLATDYLNHFNEIIMLLEMVPMMPDCLEDAKAWVPKSYEEHFRDSAFTDKELAILAYQQAPEKFRLPFDSAIEQMNTLVAEGLKEVEQAVESGEEGRIELAVSSVTRALTRSIEMASAIIHGHERTTDQSEVDAILGA